MKRLIYALVIVMSMAFSSCKEGSDDRYYVKYECVCNKINYYGNNYTVDYMMVTTDSGVKEYDKQEFTTEIFGPVSYGFKSHIKVEGDAKIKVKIYVCKENEPFVLKASNSDNYSVETSYTIDF
jgi:hypothetical protein